jgi:glycyl-tRNA synthetase (class II)
VNLKQNLLASKLAEMKMKQCTFCKSFVSVANKGSYDLEAHVNSAKRKKQIQSCSNTPKVSEFFIKQNPKT